MKLEFSAGDVEFRGLIINGLGGAGRAPLVSALLVAHLAARHHLLALPDTLRYGDAAMAEATIMHLHSDNLTATFLGVTSLAFG